MIHDSFLYSPFSWLKHHQFLAHSSVTEIGNKAAYVNAPTRDRRVIPSTYMNQRQRILRNNVVVHESTKTKQIIRVSSSRVTNRNNWSEELDSETQHPFVFSRTCALSMTCFWKRGKRRWKAPKQNTRKGWGCCGDFRQYEKQKHFLSSILIGSLNSKKKKIEEMRVWT